MPNPIRIHFARASFRWALSISLLSGCATYHVYQAGGPREMGNQPLTEWKGKTLHSLAWGAIRQDLPVVNCRLGNGTRTGIEEVRVQANFGATMAAILTLGFWRPQKFSWRCAKPPGLRGVLEPEIPDTMTVPTDGAAPEVPDRVETDSGAPEVPDRIER